MAPPTGPRGGSRGRSGMPGPDSTRHTTRGVTRGAGIGKRRVTSRTDGDGDVSMGSALNAMPPTGPANRPPRGSRGSRGGRATGGRATRSSARLAQNVQNYMESDSTARSTKPQFNKTTLKIRGLKDSKAASNPDGGLRSLLDFLERKSSKERPITIGRGTIDGDYVFIKVNKDDTPHLLRLNGYTYAGAPLSIEEVAGPVPVHEQLSAKEPGSADTKQKLLAILASRYDAEKKLLDLSALGTDPTLITMGSFASKSLAEKSFKALLHLTASQYSNADEKAAAIQAVTLANNAILDVGEVFTMAHTLPRLRRLDLSGNQLQDVSKLSKWRHEFRHLEELHLVGNPVVAQSNFQSQVVDWFPSLQILNGERVRTREVAAETLRAWFPSPLPRLPSNLRDGENNVASTFLRGFFSLYDHDRASLAAQFYDAESSFSVSFHPDSQPNAATESYTRYSRNLADLGPRHPGTQQRLFQGGPLIAELWAMLPATRHPSLDQLDQWQIDCHTFANLADPSGLGPAMGLIINVVAKAEEVDVAQQLAGVREFSRTFVLGPSKPGAAHAYRVVSDELTLRGWTPQQQVTTGLPALVAAGAAAAPSGQATTTTPTPSASSSVPVPVPAPRTLDDATRLAMVQELAAKTGMTPAYARLCLEGAADWDFAAALRSFEAMRAQLPAEAFAAGVGASSAA